MHGAKYGDDGVLAALRSAQTALVDAIAAASAAGATRDDNGYAYAALGEFADAELAAFAHTTHGEMTNVAARDADKGKRDAAEHDGYISAWRDRLNAEAQNAALKAATTDIAANHERARAEHVAGARRALAANAAYMARWAADDAARAMTAVKRNDVEAARGASRTVKDYARRAVGYAEGAAADAAGIVDECCMTCGESVYGGLCECACTCSRCAGYACGENCTMIAALQFGDAMIAASAAMLGDGGALGAVAAARDDGAGECDCIAASAERADSTSTSSGDDGDAAETVGVQS